MHPLPAHLSYPLNELLDVNAVSENVSGWREGWVCGCEAWVYNVECVSGCELLYVDHSQQSFYVKHLLTHEPHTRRLKYDSSDPTHTYEQSCVCVCSCGCVVVNVQLCESS